MTGQSILSFIRNKGYHYEISQLPEREMIWTRGPQETETLLSVDFDLVCTVLVWLDRKPFVYNLLTKHDQQEKEHRYIKGWTVRILTRARRYRTLGCFDDPFDDGWWVRKGMFCTPVVCCDTNHFKSSLALEEVGPRTTKRRTVLFLERMPFWFK